MRRREVWQLKQFQRLAVALLFGAVAAHAQTGTTAQTPLQRLLDHFDFGLSAAGVLNTSVSGKTQNTSVTTQPSLNISPSNTVGVLATLRAQRSPYVGAEFNFSYSRFADTYTFTPNSGTPGSQSPADFRAQSTVNEFTLGYVAKPPHPVFGAQPFVGGGAGTIEFKPTKNGGDNLPVQARAAYYYHVGIDKPILTDLGLRVGVRQAFYLAPDFGQNYLKVKKFASTFEPTIGIYYHF